MNVSCSGMRCNVMRLAASLSSILAFMPVSSAFADSVVAKASPKVLAAGVDPCNELDDSGASCNGRTKLKSQIGTATLYRVDAATTRLALVIETGTERLLAPPFDQWIGDCGAGSCTQLDETTAKIRMIKIAGDPAFALEIRSAWSHHESEGDSRPTTWKTRTFVICGNPGKGWSCQTRSFGSSEESCTATLFNTGAIKHTCTRTDTLEY